MKPFQFKNKGAYIRVVEEPKIPKKKWSFDRLTYMFVLCLIAFAGLRFTYKSLNVINGNGQIVFEKLSVRFGDDVRLLDIFVEEGDSIKAGDPLFVYKYEEAEDNHAISVQQAQSKGQFDSKSLDIKRTILAKDAELKVTKVMLKQQKLYSEQLIKMVLLEVESASKVEITRIEIERLKAKAQILEEEIAALKKLRMQFRSIGNTLVSAYAPQEETKTYIAPANGLSGTVNFENKELCYREQEVLTIHDPDKVEIRAYFKQKHTDFLTEGQSIKVQFPDGTVSWGRIDQSFISTYAVPKEFQKKYEPTERNIVVSILPIDKKEEELWRKYYLMEAELTIFRYGVGF
jgi:multidrug resistance efflux pump